jgi:hypothetical protein
MPSPPSKSLIKCRRSARSGGTVIDKKKNSASALISLDFFKFGDDQQKPSIFSKSDKY